MTQYQQSAVNKYMYNEFEDTDFQEQQGGDKQQLIENKEPSNIKIGGYPIQYLIHGGSNEFTRNDRFKNLVVPAGLVMEDHGLYTGGSKEPEYNAESIDRPINDELFNHLFGLTATIKSKESSKENHKRKTQKHRKEKY